MTRDPRRAPFAHASTTSLRNPPLGSLVGALFLTTSLVGVGSAAADDFFIDLNLPGFDASRTNGSLPLPLNPGDTLTLTEGTTIDILDAVGINIEDVDNLLITNNGSIITSGTDAGVNALDPGSFGYADGIFVFESNNATVINNGLVSIGDFFSQGIYIWQSSDSTVINNGDIVIREDAQEADPDGRINPNTGLPFLTAGASAGIRIDAYDNREDEGLPSEALTNHYLENNGTITSFAVQSRGMYIDGANFWDLDGDGTTDGDAFFDVNGTAVNNGRILMLATTDSSGIFDASGMRAEAHGATLTNNGYIEVRPQGFGIDYNGANGRVINNGIIRTFNIDSHGIEHYRNGTTVPDDLGQSYTRNAGTIAVEGLNNNGVSLTGHVGHTFENLGTIFSMDGYSIEVGDGNQPLQASDENVITLLDGSLLFGDVFVDRQTAAFTTMNLGDGLNATVRFEDGAHIGNGRASDLPFAFWSAHDSHVFDAATNAIYVADLDSYAQQDQAFWHLTSQLQDAIEDGVLGAETETDTLDTSFALSMMPDTSRSNVQAPTATRWASLFGGGLTGQEDGAAPSYDAFSGGVVTGVNVGSFGYFGGVGAGLVRGNEEVSYETRFATAFGGFAGEATPGVNYTLAAGLVINQTERDVADNRVQGGIDTDSVNYPSLFVSPSVRFQGPIKGSSVRLRYNGLFQVDHTFNFDAGTVLHVEDRLSHSVEARLQMQHDLPSFQFTYGLDGIWSGGADMSFDLMGVGRTSPYESGPSARGFARLSGDFWHVNAAYDTDGRLSGGLGLTVTF